MSFSKSDAASCGETEKPKNALPGQKASLAEKK
jgi:hypothetical protein